MSATTISFDLEALHRVLSVWSGPWSLATVLLILSFLHWYVILPWIRQRRHVIELTSKLPGPSMEGKNSHPWLYDFATIRSLPSVPGKPELKCTVPWFIDMLKKYSNEGLFRIWAFSPYRVPFARCVVTLSDPELIREVLSAEKFGKFRKGRLYDLSEALVGSSMLSEPDGPHWKAQRHQASPAFGTKMLQRATEVSARILQEELFPIIDANPDDVDITGYMNRLTLDILGDVAFSYPFNGIKSLMPTDDLNHSTSSTSDEESLYDTFNTIITTIVLRARSTPLRKYIALRENLKYWQACRRLNFVVSNVVDKRMNDKMRNEQKESLRKSKSVGIKATTSRPIRQQADLLSQLLERDRDGNRLSAQYICGNVRMFCFAGHETTSSSLSYALWHLASNQDIQQRLREEVDDLFTKEETCPSPTYSQLRRLRLLDAVIKETLRLNAPAGVARRTQETVKIGGHKKGATAYIIPKGVDIYIFPWWLQRLPLQWENADVFDPDRFLTMSKTSDFTTSGTASIASVVSSTSRESDIEDDDSLSTATPTSTSPPAEHAYMPFSIGPRSCIGQQMALAELRAVISHIIHRYHIEPADGAVEPFPALSLTIQPHEVSIRYRKRQS